MLLYCRDGVVLAWHDDGKAVPATAYGAGTIILPWAQPLAALARYGERPGWLGENDPDPRPYAAPVPDHAMLVGLRSVLADAVDRQAQAFRNRYVTPGGVQTATYLFKQGQAQAAAAAQNGADLGKSADALAAQYPDLANEIGITLDPQTGQPATDLYGVMRAVLAVLVVWLPLNRQVEDVRLRGKRAIAAADNAADAQAAFDAIVWPAG